MRRAGALGAAAAALLAACGGGAASATPTPAATSSASVQVPKIPDPVAVTVPKATTALLVLDLTSVVCTPRKSCVDSLPAVAALLKKARDAGAPVVYSDTPTAGSTIRSEVAPQAGEPKVSGRADKFFNTQLDQILTQKGVKTVVVTGTVANGAVLYTTFGANLRGFTAVVPVDGMSSDDPFVILMTEYQLLNEPGFANPTNKPLAAGVTLTKTNLVTFS